MSRRNTNRLILVPQVLKNFRLLAVCLGACLILPWLSTYTSGPAPNVWPWLISAACALFLWLFRQKLNGELLAVGWVLAASLSAIIGLIQYFGLAPALSPWISQTSAGEAFANLRQRNQFATLTSIGLVALVSWLALLDQRGHLNTTRLAPWWMSALTVLLALGNAASGSRTGLLQWILIALLFTFWKGVSWRPMLALALQALLAYGIAVLMLPWLLELTRGVYISGLTGRLSQATGCSSRMILWSNVLTLISQKTWLGWGWGELDYAHFITLYPGARFCEILDNAHSLPLHLAVELGLPAALAICGGLGWLALRAKPWRETRPVRQMAWGVLAVIGLHSLLEYPLWYGPFQLAVGLSIWLLGTGMDEGRRQVSHDSPRRQKFWPSLSQLAIALLLAGVLASAAISYRQVSQIYLLPAKRSPDYRDDTLNKIRSNQLFHSQARFAELSLTELTPSSAAAIYAMSSELLHYSPEPRVIEQLIESATMLGHEDEALYYLIRYKAAFPAEHARWAKENAVP